MDALTFLILNAILILCYLESRRNKEYPFVFHIIGALFSMFIMGGLIGGFYTSCCEEAMLQLPLIVTAAMGIVYLVIFIYLISLSIINLSDGFK